MRREFKIRFRQHGSDSEPAIDIRYSIQRKTLFGWSTIGYTRGGGAGDYAWFSYLEHDKEALLNKVLAETIGTTKEFVTVREYPMIKIY